MPSYQHLPQSSSVKFPLTDDEELLDIPSHFDQALNGRRNSTFLSPNSKAQDASLLDPDSFRRLSVSTISSMGRARSLSPYPYDGARDPILDKPRTWKGMFWNFWSQNQGLFLVTFSQLFGALMYVFYSSLSCLS